MKKALLKTSEIIEDYLAPPDIHDVQRESRGGFLTFIVALVAMVAEIALLRELLLGKMSFFVAMIYHLAICGVLVAYAGLFLRHPKENRFAWLLLISTATNSAFGACGTAIAVIFFILSDRRHAEFEEMRETLFPSVLQTRSQRIYDDILIGRDESSISYSVIPFLDVLAFGTENQKRIALSKMTSNFHPQFAPAFKKALSDSSNMIRVQAAASATKIEAMFLRRMIKLSMINASHRDDPIIVKALAEHYDNYAYTGLLDFDRELSNRQKAQEYYHKYLHLVPESPEIRLRIGRLLMRSRDYDKAVDWFKQCLAEGDVPETLADWYSEALFATGQYDELRQFRATLPERVIQDEAVFNPSLKEAMELWTPPKPPESAEEVKA